MRLICPSCRATHSLEAWQNDADVGTFIQMLLQVPSLELQRLLPSYLAFFRPNSGRKVSYKKLTTLLGELILMAQEPTISVDRQINRKNHVYYWVKSINQMLDCPPSRIPLKNHNYLRMVVYDMATEQGKADEIMKEKNLMVGKRTPDYQSDSNSDNVKTVKELLDEAGLRR